MINTCPNALLMQCKNDLLALEAAFLRGGRFIPISMCSLFYSCFSS